jgi:hypothetical protein
MADAHEFVSDITNFAVSQIGDGPKLPTKEVAVSRLTVKEIVSGAGDGARTRDPLLGRIRFRDSYLAES